jgi:hypothetical protein
VAKIFNLIKPLPPMKQQNPIRRKLGDWGFGLTCHEMLPVFWFTQFYKAIAKPGHPVNAEI